MENNLQPKLNDRDILFLEGYRSGRPKESIKVLLVDDHKLFREGLAWLIDDNPSFSVVGTASDGREALNRARVLKPDVVLMDISMPVLNGIEGTRLIRKASPNTKVLILTQHENRGFLDRVLAAGAHGYLLKDASSDEVYLAIESVYEGNYYLSPLISDKLIDRYLEAVKSEKLMGKRTLLTGREREVLQLLAEGNSNQKAARYLGARSRTVETHRKKIMKKLGVHHLADLVKYAVQTGIIEDGGIPERKDRNK